MVYLSELIYQIIWMRYHTCSGSSSLLVRPITHSYPLHTPSEIKNVLGHIRAAFRSSHMSKERVHHY